MDLKEFSKWLWDIAKYVVSAIIITSFLGNFEENTLQFYLAGIIVASVLFTLGIYLQYRSRNNKKSNKNKKE